MKKSSKPPKLKTIIKVSSKNMIFVSKNLTKVTIRDIVYTERYLRK